MQMLHTDYEKLLILMTVSAFFLTPPSIYQLNNKLFIIPPQN